MALVKHDCSIMCFYLYEPVGVAHREVVLEFASNSGVVIENYLDGTHSPEQFLHNMIRGAGGFLI